MKPSACGGSAPDHRTRRAQVTAMGVRRDKAALCGGCKSHPAIRPNTAPDKNWSNSGVPKDCPTSCRRCWCRLRWRPPRRLPPRRASPFSAWGAAAQPVLGQYAQYRQKFDVADAVDGDLAETP